MANIKSAKKRILVNEKKREQNLSIKSNIRTYTKKVKTLVAEGKKDEAKEMLNVAFSKIDNAASENVIHKNSAARKKASLAKLVDSMK